jgi:hypothetical protein
MSRLFEGRDVTGKTIDASLISITDPLSAERSAGTRQRAGWTTRVGQSEIMNRLIRAMAAAGRGAA